MLYDLYDFQRGVLDTTARFIKTNLHLSNHYNNKVPLPNKNMEHFLSFFAKISKLHKKQDWNIAEIVSGETLHEVRYEEVHNLPFGNLVKFSVPSRKSDAGISILLIAPMSGHHATLLRDTVRSLLSSFDVFVTDWHCASSVPYEYGSLGLDGFIDHVRVFMNEASKNGPFSVVAVCQPVVAACAAACLNHEESMAIPQSIILMGGPMDASAVETKITKYAASRPITWFSSALLHRLPPWKVGYPRKVYPGFIQLASFMSMQPERHIKSYMGLYDGIRNGDEKYIARHESFYDEYLAVADLDGRFFIDTIHHVFQNFSIARNDFYLDNGRKINVSDFPDIPIFTVEGEKDDISPPGHTIAAHRIFSHVSTKNRRSNVYEGVGHYGIFSGSMWRNVISKDVTSFIKNNGDKSK